MFSPENFYDVIKENYTTENDLLLVPKIPGEKRFNFWAPLKNLEDYSQWWNKEGLIKIYSSKLIWMYDQEPLFSSTADSARIAINQWCNKQYEETINQTPFFNLIAMFGCAGLRTTHVPIWCHSEIYSPEIALLEKNFFVPCYYWYHAFIARDWFRHYQRNQSLAVQDKSDNKYRFLLYARDFSGTRTYRKDLVERLKIYQDQIQYQWHGTHNIGSERSAQIDLSDARTAGIHLVAETLFDTSKIHLTEKVFKPMVMSQPFIIWGPPGTLKYLRSYGFKTFGALWDESYDDEQDHDARMTKLIELVKQIAQMDQSQYKKMYLSCLDIVEHNRDWFFGEKFMDFCWNELTTNFDQALRTREDLKRNNPGGQVCYVLGNNPDLARVDIFKNLLDRILSSLPDSDRKILLDRYRHFSE